MKKKEKRKKPFKGMERQEEGEVWYKVK